MAVGDDAVPFLRRQRSGKQQNQLLVARQCGLDIHLELTVHQ